jgi:hypothetical protein
MPAGRGEKARRGGKLGRRAKIALGGVVTTAVFTVVAVGNSAASSYDAGKLGLWSTLCTSIASTCADPHGAVNGYYVGHDEPSVEFRSGAAGSGNDMTYTMTLPKDPSAFPNASGAGGTTWNFELRATYWFGLTMCDNQSAPEFTQTCTPDSDSNDLVGSDPSAPNYIGKHPGTAYMELQFYPPGYVEQFEGFGCTAHQYCAAMTIDSFLQNMNNGVFNTSACNNYILGGPEPINWAYITHSGRSQAPANPLFTGTFSNPNFAAVNPDPKKDLMMNPGDTISIHMHDTSAGFRVDMSDLTTGQSGSMTASVANGFGHILYTPNSNTCQEAAYAFHPAYSTANPRGNVWTAHTYNVAMSDEVGHFENCLALDAAFNCSQPGAQDSSGLDEDDGNNFCVPGTDSTLVMIDGCFSSDEDYDSQAYRNDWPGSSPDHPVDQQLHPTPVSFTSPTTGGSSYPTVAFETDLPAIEVKGAQDHAPFCNVNSGANCVDPPGGAAFYPFFSIAQGPSGCTWHEGGDHIPGTTNDFGGSSTSEFGPLLDVLYPNTNGKPIMNYTDFNSGGLSNPC